MNLMIGEMLLMEGDNKQVTLTNYRIRQENAEWGKLHIVSIMLEHVTSCEFSRKSKPVILVLGVLCLLGSLLNGNVSNDSVQMVVAGVGVFGILLILAYFFTIKRGLIISSSSAKIVVETKRMKDENIKYFIDKLEIAKNERLKQTN